MTEIIKQLHRNSAIIVCLCLPVMLAQCKKEQIDREKEVGIASVDSTAILWDAMTAINSTANLMKIYNQNKQEWPFAIKQLQDFASSKGFVFSGYSLNGWWKAHIDSSMIRGHSTLKFAKIDQTITFYKCYSQAPTLKTPIALINSSNMVEIALKNGSAYEYLKNEYKLNPLDQAIKIYRRGGQNANL